MMNKIKNNQMRQLYKLLKDLNIQEQKEVIVPQFTADRTTHISEMTEQEADNMCHHLSNMAHEHTTFESIFNETISNYRLPKAPNIAIIGNDGTGMTDTSFVASRLLMEENNQKVVIVEVPIIAKRKSNNDQSAVNMRRKILHVLGNMGYTKEGKFDYDRINNLIENIGSNNPTKAKFNYLINEELIAVVTQVDQMYKKLLKKK